MPNTNERLRSLALQHEIRLRRYVLGLLRQMNRTLVAADRDLVSKIIARIERESSTTFTTSRLAAVLDEVQGLNSAIVRQIATKLDEQLRPVAQHELDFQSSAINKASPIEFNIVKPSVELVRAAATSEPFRGRLLSEWFTDLDAYRFKRMRDTIRIGVVEGQTVTEMGAELRQVLTMSRNNAEAVVRTAINHVVTEARDMLFQANESVIKEWQFVATLDGRTTEICMGLDGKTFPVGEGPMPPRHINCRSTMVPVTKSWAELGFKNMPGDAPLGQRPFVADTRRVKDIPPEERAELIGQVPSNTTYGEWLKAQPSAFQDEVLGPTRGALFRDGGMSVEDFASDTRAYTLDELRSRDSKAFEKAGL